MKILCYLGNWEFNGMLGRRLDGFLCCRVSSSKFLLTFPAKATILYWYLLRGYISECFTTQKYKFSAFFFFQVYQYNKTSSSEE